MLLRSVRRLFSVATLGLAPVLPLIGCAPVDALNATIPTAGLAVTQDVAYGAGPRRMLDVYRPQDAAGPLPVVVFLYGGSWRTGSKDDYKFVAAGLARRGMLVVVPDYRLYPETGYPGFLADCAEAVAWTFAHAAQYGGDPDRVFLMGHSAGAYNAAMLTLDPMWLAAAGVSRDRLAGMVGLAGPYDFLPIVDPEVIAVFGSANDPATQPVTYADAHAPPMLLLAGADDDTVLPRNTLALARDVRAAGGEAEARIYPGIGHIGIIIAFAPLFREKAPVLDDIARFVAAPHLEAASAR